MSRCFHSQPVLAILAICFALGYGHQIFGQYQPHHHQLEHHEHSAPDSGKHDENDGHDSDQLWCHHCVTAVVPTEALLAIIESFSSKLVFMPLYSMPDAPVIAIEHPPQIG